MDERVVLKVGHGLDPNEIATEIDNLSKITPVEVFALSPPKMN